MQTACLNLKCPGLLIYRGDWYECVYCHTHFPAAQIDNVEAIPLAMLDAPDVEPLSRKDGIDLIAAALGLRSSAWAKAEVHLTEPEFNFAINGEQVAGPDAESDPDSIVGTGDAP